ncbi:MAG: IclR family transcriptional regulator [Bacteroidota bacterium]|nr:IclR family transcriptional regulator [Bacteroidota bacterium]
MTKDYTVPAVYRAIQVLELLSSSRDGVSLAQLSLQTKIPKSTLFRILVTLQQHSLVVEDAERHLFTLGIKLLDWGGAALERLDIKTIAHPHMVKLAHATKESLYLAVLEHDEVILIDRVDTPEIWKIVTRLGYRSPIHCTASGQVIAAYQGEQYWNGILSDYQFTKFTATTITTAARLKKKFREIVKAGHAIADGEFKPDLFAVAVPIWDHSGKVNASLMLALHSDRAHKNKKHIDSLLASLKEEAMLISQRIGYVEGSNNRE